MHLLRWVESLAYDVRHACRGMRRSPGFALTAIATLAIGIGVNVAVFTVTNAVLFQGFRFVDNDRILYLRSQDTNHYQAYGYGVSYPDFLDWRQQAKAFSGMAAYVGRRAGLSDEGQFSDSYWASVVSANTFELIDARPILGRDFEPSDETLAAAPVVILSYKLWRDRYGRSPDVIGKVVRIDGTPTTVIGVMAEGLSFPSDSAVWMPLVPTDALRKRDARTLFMIFGRMADGVTIDGARADLDTIGRRLARAYPAIDDGFVPIARDFKDFFIGPRWTLTYESMWAAVGLLLLIACANVANLLLARATGRSREIAVRVALGAGRSRIVRQLLVESVVLSAAAGACGLWMAGWAVRTYVLFAMPGPNPYDFGMNYRVVEYLVGVSIGTGVLFGLVPAFRVSRLDINTPLKNGGRGAPMAGRGSRLSGGLIIGEMALAIVLLTGAGVMVRSLVNVYSADLGVNTASVLTAQLELPAATYRNAQAQVSFYDRVQARLGAIPGAASVAIASSLPAAGSMSLPCELSDTAALDAAHHSALPVMIVDAAYFQTLGAKFFSGRAFTAFDDGLRIPVAIVNQRLANEYWPGEDPIGKRLRFFDGPTPGAWRTVVGLVSNIVQTNLTEGGRWVQPLVYVPYRQRPQAAMSVFVQARARVPPESLATALRREIQAIDPALPVGRVVTLADHVALTHRVFDANAALFLFFAVNALLLASIGLSAVIAQTVSRRTQEIGIRMAIGATTRDILTLVLRQGLLPVGIGLAIGLTASFAVVPVLGSVLVHVSPADPPTFMITPVVLIVAGLLGCLIPARQATRVDPVVALRHE